MAEWQTIDSAPKDGTHILGWDGSEMFTCNWVPYTNGRWRLIQAGSYAEDSDCDPTHWQRLPEPPRGT